MAPYQSQPSETLGRARLGRRSFVAFLALLSVMALIAGALPRSREAAALEAATSLGPRSRHTPERDSEGEGRADNVTLPAPAATASPGSSPAARTPDTSDNSTGSSGPRARITGPLQRIAAAGEPVYCGAGSKPLVALTFDDGPGILSPKAIAQLDEHGATATFFLVGKLIGQPQFDGVIRDEMRLDAAFGDHTWNHVSMLGAGPSGYASEIARTRRAAQSATGQRITLFRPPLGQHDDRLDAYLGSQGMLEILWSVDSQDSQGASAEKIYRNVRNNLSAGDIILLHDNRGTTEKALPRILDLIARRGLTPVTVPQLLAQDPPSHAQLRAHTCS